LEQESGISAFTLTDKQIEMIWKYLSGSMFEISSVLAKLIPRAKNKCVETKNIKKEIDRLITINCGKFEHYIQLHKQKFKLFQQILIIHEKKNIFFLRDLHELVSAKIYTINDLSDELKNLVRINILSFNPTTAS